MKRIAFLLLLILALVQTGKAQFGLHVGFVKPSGTFGYVFKPALTGGFGFYNEFDEDRFNYSLTFGITKFNPRQDTFYGYGMQYGGSGTKYLPSYTVYNYYWQLSSAFQVDFEILDKAITPTVGLGVNLIGTFYSIDHELATVIESSEVSNGTILGYSPRIGVLYEMDEDFFIHLTASSIRAKDFSAGEKTPMYLFQLNYFHYF